MKGSPDPERNEIPMILKNADAHSRLARILDQPNAPFREGLVMAEIESILRAAKVPFFRDPAQNLVVGVASKAAYRKLLQTPSKEPVRMMIAHLDHPGFHGVEWQSASGDPSGRDLLTFKWHGGSPTAHLEGAKVWLADSEGFVGEGRVEKATLIPSGRALESGSIRIKDLRRAGRAAAIYGGFAFRENYWVEGDRLYTKCADDLIGAFAIVETAIARQRSRAKSPFIGLLTRAEEVGFIGAIAHFELGWWKTKKRPVIAVSLETSRALPGAEIGRGPIVRLGDRKSVFHSAYTQVFSDLAARILPGRHQRRIMDGGSCEGTAATAYGIPTIAVSVPLGNYHNQSFEGGSDAAPSNGPAPEFVSVADLEDLLTLTQSVMTPKLGWDRAYDATLKSFRASLKKYGALMRTGP